MPSSLASHRFLQGTRQVGLPFRSPVNQFFYVSSGCLLTAFACLEASIFLTKIPCAYRGIYLFSKTQLINYFNMCWRICMCQALAKHQGYKDQYHSLLPKRNPVYTEAETTDRSISPKRLEECYLYFCRPCTWLELSLQPPSLSTPPFYW